MARIAGVNVPENKHLEIALTHIYGIGKKTAQDICLSVKLDCSQKVSDLSEEQIEMNCLTSQDNQFLSQNNKDRVLSFVELLAKSSNAQ